MARWRFLLGLHDHHGANHLYCGWLGGMCSRNRSIISTRGLRSSSLSLHDTQSSSPSAPFPRLTLATKTWNSMSRGPGGGLGGGGRGRDGKAPPEVVLLEKATRPPSRPCYPSSGGRRIVLSSPQSPLAFYPWKISEEPAQHECQNAKTTQDQQQQQQPTRDRIIRRLWVSGMHAPVAGLGRQQSRR